MRASVFACNRSIAVLPGAVPEYGPRPRAPVHFAVRCPWCGSVLEWRPGG